jgi:hypothetical protein
VISHNPAAGGQDQRAGQTFNLNRLVWIAARALTVVLLAGGAIGAVTSFTLQRDLWPWLMPDLAYRFLAGAAAAYAVGSLLTLLRRGWAETELLLATVILYGIPLGAALLIEPDPVDWGEPVAWGTLALVVPALGIGVVAIGLNRGRLKDEPGASLSKALRAALLVLALASGAIGALVFIAPRESGFVWPWAELAPWKPLDSRLLASMLLTIAGGAALVAVRNRRAMARVFLPMLWAYCVVTAIGLALHAADTPALRTEDLIYIAVFGLIVVATLAFWFDEPAAR